MTALLLVAAAQTRARSLDYRIDCLRFGSNTAILSPLMPGIVADGDKAVAPLIRACREAIARDNPVEKRGWVACYRSPVSARRSCQRPESPECAK